MSIDIDAIFCSKKFECVTTPFAQLYSHITLIQATMYEHPVLNLIFT